MCPQRGAACAQKAMPGARIVRIVTRSSFPHHRRGPAHAPLVEEQRASSGGVEKRCIARPTHAMAALEKTTTTRASSAGDRLIQNERRSGAGTPCRARRASSGTRVSPPASPAKREHEQEDQSATRAPRKRLVRLRIDVLHARLRSSSRNDIASSRRSQDTTVSRGTGADHLVVGV